MADQLADEKNTRIILLNTLHSVSKCSTRNQTPPTVLGSDLMKVLEDRRTKKPVSWAVEYFGAEEDDDEAKRIAAGQGKDYIRICDLSFSEDGKFEYVAGLVEYMDASISKFAMVNYTTFKGHNVSGGAHDRGAVTAHFLARFPKQPNFDDGSYRCAIEVVHGITRSDIEVLFCRQLRRYARAEKLSFAGEVADKKGKINKRGLLYWPRLELAADVGRKLDFAISGKGELSGMVFTKHSERRTTAGPVAVKKEDFVADVRVYVGAKQGPADPNDRVTWATKIREGFTLEGYSTKILFRHANGKVATGDLHKSVNAAVDLIMCPKEQINLDKPPENWVAAIQPDIADKMRVLVDDDALWQRRK